MSKYWNKFYEVQKGTIQNGVFAFVGKKISHLPTLIASQGLKNWSLTIKFLARHHLYVNYMCAKRFTQKGYSKSTNMCSQAMKKISLLPTLTPSKDWKKFLSYENFDIRPSICWLHVWKIWSPKDPHKKEYLKSTNMCRCEKQSRKPFHYYQLRHPP